MVFDITKAIQIENVWILILSIGLIASYTNNSIVAIDLHSNEPYFFPIDTKKAAICV